MSEHKVYTAVFFGNIRYVFQQIMMSPAKIKVLSLIHK